MNKKQLVIGISCFHPKKYSKSFWEKREEDYLKSIKSIKNLELNSDLLLIDNSISDICEIQNHDLKNELIEVFGGAACKSLFYGFPDCYSTNNDEGYRMMVIKSFQNICMEDFEIITILNLRRYFLSSYWFFLVDEMISNKNVDILLVSEKKTSLFTLETVPNKPLHPISDAIISFKNKIFKEYCKELIGCKNKYSEDFLYNFSQKYNSKIISNIGLARNDWDIKTHSTILENIFVL